VRTLATQHASRPEALKRLDVERDLTPDWFQRERMVGYVFYVERFAGDLLGVLDHLDYLEELGVTYVHLMYVLRPREGENDGGYAIADYRDVDPRLGTIDDLVVVCDALRERGIASCVDLVLNHCADSHAWARAARDGDPHYQDYFYAFPDRSEPDAFERTLPEVFPDFAPGNFSWVGEMERWVWTTFHGYQWDLNWSNPEVLLEVVEIMGELANRGVDVFRMDAVAFMWKRLGTDCQNQPEVHDLLQALRACSKIATPAVAHKAEAIVSPGDLMHYFGTGRRYGKVANIAYHNSLMVQTWSALASRDARLMTHTLRAYPPAPPSIAWGCYVRCHDDIGWAVTDEDAAAVGWSGGAHRAFLSDFYSGQFSGSFARGAVFQYNPTTGDRRISGSCASLAGSRRRSTPATRSPWGWRSSASCGRTRWPAASEASRCCTWATSSGCSTTIATSTTRTTGPTTAGCTAPRWTGPRRTAATCPAPSRRASSTGCWRSCARVAARRISTRRRPRRCSTRATRRPSRSCDATRWGRWPRSTTSATSPRSSTRAG
jgi:amylosucrase